MRLRTFMLVPIACGLAQVAAADYIWASLVPATNTVAIGLQEGPDSTPLPLGERLPLVKAFEKSLDKPLTLKQDGTYLKASYTGDVVGVDMNYGVIDRREQGRGLFWLYYYAKAALTPQASQKKLKLGVELMAKMVDGKPVVTVLRNGKPADKASVLAILPDKTEFKGETGADGTVVIPQASGKLAVRALVAESVKGTEAGKAYDFRRSYGSLTVERLD